MAENQFNASKMIFMSFALTILAGAGLLWLPVSHSQGQMSFINALFMSTSAVCVTGLSVMDIGTQFTFFGQCVMLGLIQVGGLGIMTISVFLMMVLRQKFSLASYLSVNFEPQHHKIQSFFYILLFVFSITLAIELLGAALLFPRFNQIHTGAMALFSSFFHAVSAFCNAGFSLYADSLTRFQKDPFVLGVFIVLIIVGGLGFMVLDELWIWVKTRVRGKSMVLSLHARICIIGTLVLILLGTLIVWILESRNLLAGFSARDQFWNALFLSVTSRTAGFNTLPTSSLTNATLFFVIWLMFIGACPGSTGGGIKVPTFITLIALIKNQMQGRSTSLLQRKIPIKTVARSLAVFTSAFLIINGSTFFFQMSEHIGASHLQTQGSFLDLLFEVTSAFGTVGLTTGVTQTLTLTGKMLVICLMFLGRIGPLTLGALFLLRRRGPSYEYVEEDIAIG